MGPAIVSSSPDLHALARRVLPHCAAFLVASLAACGASKGVDPRSLAAQERGFIVLLDAGAAPAEARAGKAGERRAMAGSRAIAAQSRVLSAVPGLEVLHRYANLPILHVRALDEAAARSLVGHAAVVRVELEVAYAHQLLESLPLVRQGDAKEHGQLGAGTTIAIVDGPVDRAAAAFGPCAEPGAVGSPGCKLAAVVRFAPGAGAALSRAHATNVAAIALGVAPGARIAALDVFSGPTAFAGEILAAIDWAIEHQAELGIAALNLSLGAGEHTAPCADDAMSVAIAWARMAGIVTTAAAGNDGRPSAIASPACAPAAVSVGAVYDSNVGRVSFGSCIDEESAADRVACFSNAAPWLTLLAPGAMVTAGGSTMAGTSQAAPFVAGAAAVLRAAFPAETSSEIVQRLRKSGALVTDRRTGLLLPRLDLRAALALPALGAPLGSVAFAQGEVSPGPEVTLRLSGLAGRVPAEVCLSNGPLCLSGYRPFAEQLPWRLLAGVGPRTIRAWFRTRGGSESEVPASATVLLDPEPPADGTLAADGAASAIELHWWGFSDATSGIDSYRLVAGAAAAPPSCEAGEKLYEGPGATFVERSLSRGAARGYRLCARDRAGWWSAGSVASAEAL